MDEEAANALWQVKAAGLIAEEGVHLCVLVNGARWLWKQGQALFASAVAMLHCYHSREHFHKVAVRPYGAHPERLQA
jgi:hypothetical protein